MGYFGCHLSASGGNLAMVHTALDIGANTFAFFTRNPRGSKAKKENPADAARAVAALQEAKRMAGKVIWLNPIPESKWKYLRSVQTMAAICPMVSCSTLKELAAACRKLTRI